MEVLLLWNNSSWLVEFFLDPPKKLLPLLLEEMLRMEGFLTDSLESSDLAAAEGLMSREFLCSPWPSWSELIDTWGV